MPVAPGVATDILARMAGEWLQKRTGQTVIIENRPGAGGNTALQHIAKSDPDGHTLLVATNGAITISPALFKNRPVDSAKDVAPVAMLANVPQLLTINGNIPARNAQELITLAKARPGTINYGSAGPGSTPHLTVALFGKLAGIDIVHVPYRGLGPALTDLVAGNIQALSIGYGSIASFVQSGQLRIIGVAGPERLSYLPNVPSAREIGLPAWEVETWYGMFAPGGTPKAIIDQLNAHIMALLDDPATRKKFEESYYDIVMLSADAFTQRVKSDLSRWPGVVAKAGIEVQ